MLITFAPIQLAGSLIILAENVMGSIVVDESGETILQYGTRCIMFLLSLPVNNHISYIYNLKITLSMQVCKM